MVARKVDFKKRIDIFPSPKVFERQFGVKIPKRLMDFKPAFRRLAPFVARGIRANIQSRGANIGEKWDLKAESYPAYVERKRREGFSRLDLHRTGNTVKDITNPKAIVSLTKRQMSFGVKGAEYEHVPRLNFGLRLKYARPFMGWSDRMLRDTDKVMGDHAEKIIQDAAKEINAGRA